MRIGGTQGVSFGPSGGVASSRPFRVEPTATAGSTGDRPAAAQGRALALVEPPAASETPTERLARHRVHAPFLAQLLATRDGIADTRRLRRAEPRHAAGAYGMAMTEPSLLVPGYLVDIAS